MSENQNSPNGGTPVTGLGWQIWDAFLRNGADAMTAKGLAQKIALDQGLMSLPADAQTPEMFPQPVEEPPADDPL